MELKLKRRELKIDVYGDSSEVLRFPSFDENNDYTTDILSEEKNEKEVTTKFLTMLGMNEKSVSVLELPDMIEIISVLTGQKKI